MGGKGAVAGVTWCILASRQQSDERRDVSKESSGNLFSLQDPPVPPGFGSNQAQVLLSCCSPIRCTGAPHASQTPARSPAAAEAGLIKGGAVQQRLSSLFPLAHSPCRQTHNREPGRMKRAAGRRRRMRTPPLPRWEGEGQDEGSRPPLIVDGNKGR